MFSSVDPLQLRRWLSATSGWGSVAIVVAYTALWVLRSLRIGWLLPRGADLRELLWVNGGGFLAVGLVPLRLGELVRPWLLVERQIATAGEALAAIAMERVLDLVFLGLLVAWTGALLNSGSGLLLGGVDVLPIAGSIALVGSGGVFGGLTVLALWSRSPRPDGRVPGALHAIGGSVRALLTGGWSALWAVLATATMWVVNLFAVAATLMATVPDQLSLAAVVTGLSGMTAGMLAVPSPAGVGGVEAGGVAGLVATGVDPAAAAVAVAVLHVVGFGHTSVVGVVCLTVLGARFGDVFRRSLSLGPPGERANAPPGSS